MAGASGNITTICLYDRQKVVRIYQLSQKAAGMPVDECADSLSRGANYNRFADLPFHTVRDTIGAV